MDGRESVMRFVTAGQRHILSPETSWHIDATRIIAEYALSLVGFVSDLKSFASICRDDSYPVISIVGKTAPVYWERIRIENYVIPLA